MIRLLKTLFCHNLEFVPCLSPSDASDRLKAFKITHPDVNAELAVIGNTFGFKYYKNK